METTNGTPVMLKTPILCECGNGRHCTRALTVDIIAGLVEIAVRLSPASLQTVPTRHPVSVLLSPDTARALAILITEAASDARG